ncbi:NlpC/P60 family protein [Henriciella sp.]|uniref:NlpC/P60 family protein n=1 Tax=Henriciella sp. TaxID=1968823 RepID=UPI000C11565B|nr:NlpC/P60 family protein [Henriciella sp.]PHR83095.1 MAG: hypothetical protein COA64_00120 [Henriciella sp.]
MSDRQAIISDMLETTYEVCGRGPEAYDCYGMVVEVCRRMGWPVPRDPLPHWDNPRDLLRIFNEQVRDEEWKRCAVSEGAVAFVPKFAAARHVGIVIAGGILHTQAPVITGGETVSPGGPEWLSLTNLPFARVEYARWDS